MTSTTSTRVEVVESGARRLRWLIFAVLVGLIAAGAAVVIGASARGGRGGGSSDSAFATSLATMQRRSLSQTTQFNGTLGYAGSYIALSQLHGTVTWLPKVGRVVREGQVLYRVDGAPVVLLYGSSPAYRPLAQGAYASDVKGRDVAQLNHDLVALGYADRSDVAFAWRDFGWATKAGVEKLQRHLGVKQTGTLDFGDVVFLPTAARVTALQARLGGPAAGPVLSASSTARTVSVALDPALQSQVRAGDRVAITLPDGRTTPGRVSSVGRVATVASNNADASSDTGPTVPVTIRPIRLTAAAGLDQALVEVAITDRTVRNVLAVPVDALVALAGGSYAVEVVAGDGTHHLLAVTLGLFDDAVGMVQVSRPGLAAGLRVVVPGR